MKTIRKKIVPTILVLSVQLVCLVGTTSAQFSGELLGVRNLGNTNDEALLLIDPTTGFGTDFAVIDDVFLFNAMASDRIGNHWMIGFSGGAHRLARFTPFLEELFVGPETDFPANSNSADALAFHPEFGLYAVGINDELIKVNTDSGVGELIVDLPNIGVQGLAFSLEGRLFGWSIEIGLIEIDPATGDFSDVTTGDGGAQIQCLEFDDFGTLFGARDALYEIDIDSGAQTLIGVNNLDVRGMAFAPAIPLSQFPEELDVVRGNVISGSISELQQADEERLILTPGFTLNSTEAPVWLVLDANVAMSDFLSFSVQSQAGTPGLTATVEAFNWQTSSWFEVGNFDAAFGVDSFENFALDDPGFQSFGGRVRSRVGWRSTGFTINFPWEVRVDWIFWQV